jgi:nucleoid DNA-binding protein
MGLKKSDIAKNISSKASISGSASKELVDSFIDIIKSKSNEQDVKLQTLVLLQIKLLLSVLVEILKQAKSI